MESETAKVTPARNEGASEQKNKDKGDKSSEDGEGHKSKKESMVQDVDWSGEERGGTKQASQALLPDDTFDQSWSGYIGRAVEHLSRLYGYGLINGLFNAVYVVIIASMPFTIWRPASAEEARVPSPDIGLWIRGFFPFIVLLPALFTGFNVSSREPDGKAKTRAKYAWLGGCLGNLLSSLFWWLVFQVVPHALGLENPK